MEDLVGAAGREDAARTRTVEEKGVPDLAAGAEGRLRQQRRRRGRRRQGASCGRSSCSTARGRRQGADVVVKPRLRTGGRRGDTLRVHSPGYGADGSLPVLSFSQARASGSRDASEDLDDRRVEGSSSARTTQATGGRGPL